MVAHTGTENGSDSSGGVTGAAGSDLTDADASDTPRTASRRWREQHRHRRHEPIPIPGETAPPTEDGCGVLIESTPKAGHPLTVLVYQDLEPAGATRVWFNDRYVGWTTEREG